MSDTMFQNAFSEAKWIWVDEKNQANDLVIFRKKITLAKKVRNLVARIAVDSHYYLNINGKFVVWEGGINHPFNSEYNGYFDELDIAKYMKKGDNAIVVVCKYFGNSGNDSVDKGKPGFIMELIADEDNILASSGETFDAYRNEANIQPETVPTVNYAGFNHTYDATTERQLSDVYLATFGSNIFTKAVVLGAYGDAPWGMLKERTLPQYDFSKKPVFLKPKKSEIDAQTMLYEIALPRPMLLYPIMIVTALGREKIKIYTDRRRVYGDFGDKTEYEGQSVEYVCKATAQTYESFGQLYGQRIFFEIPKTVKVKKLGCRTISYNGVAKGSIVCSDRNIGAFLPKCVNTLKACMTDKIINNPDRDRALTLDSLNIAGRAIMRLYGEDGNKLIRKSIADIFNNIQDDVLYSNVPSKHPFEISSAGLLTVSELGLFAAYSDSYSDMDEYFLNAAVRYLEKWSMDEDGLVVLRGGWVDNLFNVDSTVIENCLYYSALRFAKALSGRLNQTQYLDFVDGRMASIENAFENAFFNGLGYSAAGSYHDDRANAFAVLCGLCKPEHYEMLADLLVSTQNASPYFEGFILEALCKMDRNDYARSRLSARYADIGASGIGTLPEQFALKGACTASRSAGPFNVLMEYFAGISIAGGGTEISVTPDLGDLESLTFACVTPKGMIRGKYTRLEGNRYEYIIENDTKGEVMVNLKSANRQAVKNFKIGKGKFKYALE